MKKSSEVMSPALFHIQSIMIYREDPTPPWFYLNSQVTILWPCSRPCQKRCSITSLSCCWFNVSSARFHS